MPAALVLIDKQPGWTSHDVVAKLRGILGTRKIGHAGTLDPMATGLLVLGVDGGTKILQFISGSDSNTSQPFGSGQPLTPTTPKAMLFLRLPQGSSQRPRLTLRSES